jgi:small subunit ribosomal protein S20
VPRIKSSKKRMRQARRRAQHNRARRTAIRTVLKKARADLTPEAVAKAIRWLDRGARKGLIHRNTAARKKARLMRRLKARA